MDFNNYFNFLLEKTKNPRDLFLLRSYRKKNIENNNTNIDDLKDIIPNYLDLYNEFKNNITEGIKESNIIKEDRINKTREERIKRFKNNLPNRSFGFQNMIDSNSHGQSLFGNIKKNQKIF